MEGFYYIENSINEFSSAIIGYFTDLSSAKEALKDEIGEEYFSRLLFLNESEFANKDIAKIEIEESLTEENIIFQKGEKKK